MPPLPTIDISTSGRGGTILFHEGPNTASFDWEFAGGSALALIFGPAAGQWDRRHPWAAGRQEEIFRTLAVEVVQRQAPGGSFECDLDSGTITIYSARAAGR